MIENPDGLVKWIDILVFKGMSFDHELIRGSTFQARFEVRPLERDLKEVPTPEVKPQIYSQWQKDPSVL